MKVKIKRSMSASVDGSHPALEEGAVVELDEKTAKYLIEIGNALEMKPAVKVQGKPVEAKKAVKK
ncbi:MAG TPA: hypothetical protein PLU23_00695 [Anaerolineaceae bacterium]|nr:hypothetical protein [Anaerolineaceae bacterium]